MATSTENLTSALIVASRDSKESPFKLSKMGQKLDDESNGMISNRMSYFGKIEPETSRLIYGAHDKYKVIAISFTESKDLQQSNDEWIDLKRENVRRAIGDGIGKLKEIKVNDIFVDSTFEPSATAEAAFLRNYKFNFLKESELCRIHSLDASSVDLWCKGEIFSESQNWARYLTELPANHLHPGYFCELITNELSKDCKVVIRDENWINEQKMGCFSSVARGSSYPPYLAEVHYNGRGNDTLDCILIGKGITFDTGGVSLKPAKSMGDMRGDMGGAATVVATMKAISKLKLKLNVIAFIPTCENAIGNNTTRPSDVVTSYNGKTVQIDNTDAEGRLILADSLAYASRNYDPKVVVTIATLTGAIGVALGPVCAGAYTASDKYWKELKKASEITGDRVWRMPHFEWYSTEMKNAPLADINNISGSPQGGANTAAAFLRQFNEKKSLPYIHLDIAAVCFSNESQSKYLIKGMTGRPTRTLIEFLSGF